MPRDLTLIDQIILAVQRECTERGRPLLAKHVAETTGLSMSHACRILSELRADGVLPEKMKIARAPRDPIRCLQRATKKKCQQRLAPWTPDEIRKNARRRQRRAIKGLLKVATYDGALATENANEIPSLVD